MQKAWPVKKKRSGKKIAFAMILILSVAAFGYSQYSAITSISSTMINSQDMGAVPLGHMYKIKRIKFPISYIFPVCGDCKFRLSYS